MSEQEIQKINKIHFIGIGGIGMSALARLFLSLGKEVSGSDLRSSDITKNLEKEGVKIFNSQTSQNISPDIDIIVYTLAVPRDNPEIIQADNLNIKKFYYAEMLGFISKNFYTIAVSGTHGKTTTTAMLAKVFQTADQNPNVIVGSIISDAGTNYIKGDDEFFIVEACEYKRSFLNLFPKIVIVTNLEEDHLDYYKNLEDIQNAFHDLLLKLPKDGFVICDPNDSRVSPILKNISAQVIDYMQYVNEIPDLKIPGQHNVLNASAVLAVAKILNLDLEKAKNGLQNFIGTWRRAEFIKETPNNNLCYDDYAHHPTEIRVTLSGFKDRFKDYEINVIFEPHLYSRTKELFSDFVSALTLADRIILTPIYAAREILDPSINSEMLTKELIKNKKNAFYFENFNLTKEWIKDHDFKHKKQIFITMGAGDIYQIWKDNFLG
jgi:UDP-N-acetylmuramate--alanine ligase